MKQIPVATVAAILMALNLLAAQNLPDILDRNVERTPKHIRDGKDY